MSVTAPAGFDAAGVRAGLKESGRPDVAVVVNTGPLNVAAAVFTTNRVVAAPVVWSRTAVADGFARAVVLNSGGANACTGAPGYRDTENTAEFAATRLNLRPTDVLVCSTGLIGELLPMGKLLPGVAEAIDAAHDDGGPDAAEAILTTDTVTKQAVQIRRGWSVGGMAKGAGMLAPGLATMLVVLTTDAAVPRELADSALREAVRTTFNRVDSDGCMSTNDTVILMVSGSSRTEPASEEEFTEALRATCADLARQLVADAEGASHDIAVTVKGATTEEAAEAVARAITSSNLFKAAIFGNDPNWGRVLAAAGTVPEEVAPYNPDAMDVWMNGVQVARAGGVGEDRALVDLTEREVSVVVDLHAGEARATIWTNDLTHDYVHENSAYST
ncbi:MAG TPA: bifunctional glutamate N-acetyltransferase/amino-acid acetyltransferase ArgJ [Actinomycetales bacterium]|nr:bifunctional glutamate N-acetyltransferase/amino-acid acetyltransferase ArgJ [Actinomycetales bacterium]